MAILNRCQVLFYKWFSGKNGVSAGRSTWRVLPWHGGGSEYLEGTADAWGGHVQLTIELSFNGVSPFPRDIY
jgi:hypothetical protein